MNGQYEESRQGMSHYSGLQKVAHGANWVRRREPVIFYGICLVMALVVYVTAGLYNDTITAGDYAAAMGTMILAMATFALVVAQRHSNYIQSRPAVAVGIETERSIDAILLVFTVSNNGGGLAKNVFVRCEPDLVNENGEKMTDAPPFSAPYPLLGKGITKRVTIGRAILYLRGRSPGPFRYCFTVTYHDSEDNRYEHVFVEDLSVHKSTVII